MQQQILQLFFFGPLEVSSLRVLLQKQENETKMDKPIRHGDTSKEAKALQLLVLDQQVFLVHSLLLVALDRDSCRTSSTRDKKYYQTIQRQ